MARLWLSLSTLALSLGFAPALQADLFVLSNGGQIEGRLLNPQQQPRTVYVIETTWGGKISLTESQVERVVVKSAVQRRYEQWLPRMPATADGNWRMAQWCETNKLVEHREHHLLEVIRLDADHVEARHALGYSRVGDRWLIMEDYMRSQGYVRYRGGWRTPQELALAETAQDQDQAEKDWRRTLKRWRGWIGKKRSQEGIANIRAIDDPLAAAALADMLEDEETSSIRKMLVEVLGGLPTSTADVALAKTSLEDNDRSVREAALDQLHDRHSRAAVATFIKALDSKENRQINRAGVALGWMRDQSAVRPLIEALTSKHKQVVNRGGSGGLGSIGATFGNNGANGLTAGGKPKIVEFEVRNKSVLDALVMLTDEHFLYDKRAWRNWFINEHTSRGVELRRRD